MKFTVDINKEYLIDMSNRLGLDNLNQLKEKLTEVLEYGDEGNIDKIYEAANSSEVVASYGLPVQRITQASYDMKVNLVKDILYAVKNAHRKPNPTINDNRLSKKDVERLAYYYDIKDPSNLDKVVPNTTSNMDKKIEFVEKLKQCRLLDCEDEVILYQLTEAYSYIVDSYCQIIKDKLTSTNFKKEPKK